MAMQQTSFDRKLRKKYVYITYVYANTLPQTVPYGVTVDETTEELGGMYLYRFTAPTEKHLHELTARLEVENITYTSRIADSSGVSNSMFNNEHKSFTMQMAWLAAIIIILAIIFSGLPIHLWNTLSKKEEPEKGDKKALIQQVEKGSLPS